MMHLVSGYEVSLPIYDLQGSHLEEAYDASHVRV